MTTAMTVGIAVPEAGAQTVNIVTSLDSIEGVTITQPSELPTRLQRNEKAAASSTGSGTSSSVAAKSGYRVEVYADNNRAAKAEAASRRARVQSRFPQYRVYQTFEAPFWRVKLGDFRSRNEATEVMNEIRRAFPSYSPFLRVVRDRIN